MRTVRLATVAAVTLAALVVIPQEPAGASPAALDVDLTPAAGSTNVAFVPGELWLGPAPARTGAAGVARRVGIAQLTPVRLPAPVTAVTVSYRAHAPAGSSVEVDARVRLDRVRWTEWTPAADGATAVLPAAGRTVQLRVLLTAGRSGASPYLAGLRLTPLGSTARTPARKARDTLTAHVFATREGLVGGTTASGHVIVKRDRFAALPSRRGLSAAGDGDYSVKVCTQARCAWAPVWDVGPWNVHDDYWNSSSVRERFTDLSRGVPEAQAAYRHGYRDGKDGYGREVTNPAGIDLADGTFWVDLGLDDNAWVDVTYLWTGDGVFGRVRTGLRAVLVRAAPDTSATVVGGAADHAAVRLLCRRRGDEMDGPDGPSRRWYRVGEDMYLPAARVSDAGEVPHC